ncbi:uncharacterized protein BHQ10_007291 [Talaromyces amestolkiae]|uniref:Ig-like domain-containing protein n=1 Tax=Talaromyces amestolkiae TaxID=1196081 RepID=A0A364L662_TALAM|nr:uncharacterized protein BHQ10_007291 [Talaromyces amestolkiae]RAO71279.1 hypothetical protein BHQ10_007291 [Talaromyces amestolkiae]
MGILGNVTSLLCILLALAVTGISYPTTINITAEDFANMPDIKVRSDGTIVPHTGTIDMVCGGCTPSYSYSKVGDGNPHQNFVITQKGGTSVECSTPETSTGTGYSLTLGWSMSLGLDAEFSSLGFEVTEEQSYSVSNTFTCDGVAAERGSICVLFYQAVTAFTVQVTEELECACGESSTIDRGTAIVYAPNADQIGSVQARGINVVSHGVEQCWGESDRTINYYCGPPGLPDFWRLHDAGPWVDDYVNKREPAGCDIPIEANQYYD